MRKKLMFLMIILILLVTMIACTPKVTEDIKGAKDIVKEEVKDVKDAIDKNIIKYGDITIDPMKAFDIFREKYPEKLVKRMELDKELGMGSYVYRVEGYDEKNNGVEVNAKEININPVSGAVSDPDTKISIHVKYHKEITKSNVEKIQALIDKSLLDAGSGSMVSDWKLRWDDKILKFELGIDLPGLGDIDYTYNILTDELIDKD